jgi:membrane protein
MLGLAKRLSTYRLVRLANASWSSFLRTNCTQMAAGIALFAMLSLLPLLMVIVSVGPDLAQPLAPGYDVRRAILHFAQLTISPVARRWLQEVLQSLADSSAVVDVFSFLTFVWATSNVFSQVDVSFHRIWEDESSLDRGISFRQAVIGQFRRRRNALLLLGLVVISFVGTGLLGRWLAGLEGGPAARRVMLPIATSLSSWIMGAFILALLYRWLAPARVPWRAVLLGAAVASAANQVVSLLVASFVDTTIGATNVNIGGPLALMLGVFLFVQNILIGCVIVRQYVLLEVQPNRPLPQGESQSKGEFQEADLP